MMGAPMTAMRTTRQASSASGPQGMHLDRRGFLNRTAVAAALGALGPAGCTTAPLRPSRPLNVLVVLADDLGWGDLSCYGRRDFEHLLSTPSPKR